MNPTTTTTTTIDSPRTTRTRGELLIRTDGGLTASSRASSAASAAPKKSDDIRTMFPWKLHQLLEDAENEGLAHVVAWQPNGASFKVHKRDEFMRDILPRYFKQSKYKSFVRQLNLWGFSCMSAGPEKGSYKHDKFIRSDRELCLSMNRTKIKGPAKHRPTTTRRNETPHPVPTISNSATMLIDILYRGGPREASNGTDTCTLPASQVPFYNYVQQLQPNVPSSSSYGLVALADNSRDQDESFTSGVPSTERLRYHETFTPSRLSSVHPLPASSSFEDESFGSCASAADQRQFHEILNTESPLSVPSPTSFSLKWAQSIFDNDPVLLELAAKARDEDSRDVALFPSADNEWMDALLVDEQVPQTQPPTQWSDIHMPRVQPISPENFQHFGLQ